MNSVLETNCAVFKCKKKYKFICSDGILNEYYLKLVDNFINMVLFYLTYKFVKGFINIKNINWKIEKCWLQKYYKFLCNWYGLLLVKFYQYLAHFMPF